MSDKPAIEISETEAVDEQGNLKTATLSKSGGRTQPWAWLRRKLRGGESDD